MKKLFTFIFLIPILIQAQLPIDYYYSNDGKILYCGGQEINLGFYAKDSIKNVYLNFSNPATYWFTLQGNYSTEKLLGAKMILGTDTLPDSVGVRFQGTSSYSMTPFSQKKSFALKTDYINSNQNINGYLNLNFKNCHQDSTMMREVIYSRMAARHIPMPKTNFIRLFLNNQDWGIYPNVQSIDKAFIKEWFLNNEGAMFNPKQASGTGLWGDSVSSMIYLDSDTNSYKSQYKLDFNNLIVDPWTNLLNATSYLKQVNNSNLDNTFKYLDLDRILWQLACEVIFNDEDSYISKSKVFYRIYTAPESGLTTTLEQEGNYSLRRSLASSSQWTVFKNSTMDNYPLMSKLIAIPELRQRYLAHFRTILNETFTAANGVAIVNDLDVKIQALVTADTKKLYSNARYSSDVNGLKAYFTNRRNFLISDPEISEVAPIISSAKYYNSLDLEYGIPKSNEIANIKAEVTSASGIRGVFLYSDTGLLGNFTKIQMFDDGIHNDGTASDGIYGAQIPGFKAGTMVRYYVEARANNASFSSSYLPTGADHDVFIYHVVPGPRPSTVVINEIVALNNSGKKDEMGEYSDWIELHNYNTTTSMDISGYYLTNDTTNLTKWEIPPFTIIPPNGYVTFWCDAETSQGLKHTNFKLSGTGETIYFLDNNLYLADQVKYSVQTNDSAYARIPNGTGSFIIKTPTYNSKNDSLVIISTSPYTKNLTGVVINELVSVNTRGEKDEAGDYSDWIEIYNSNNYTVDLSYSSITSDTFKWVFPLKLTIEPKSYMMIWADTQLSQGNLHASFRLPDFNGTIKLIDSANIVKQNINYSNPTANLGYARIPNATGNFIEKSPTFSLKNETVSNNLNGVVINEINAYNNTGARDELDGFDNWLELYNNSNDSIDISGYYLSDDQTQLYKWQIPLNTTIHKNEYIIFWTDNELLNGPFHTNWILDHNGGKVFLYDPLARFVDQMTYGKQIPDSSSARIPNGTGIFKSKVPTFKSNNVTGNVGSISQLRFQDIKVYPNPAKENFSILTGSNIKGTISYQIKDLTGRTILSGVSKPNENISISTLNSGTYILQISVENQLKTIKLTKN